MEESNDALFNELASTCSEVGKAFTRYIGMSLARRQILTIVSRMGEISHAVLQQQLALDGATVTRLVKQFEAEGVLSRRIDPHDNRYTLVSLTEAGQHLVTGLKEAHSHFQARLLAGIAREEQESMLNVLERLRDNIRTVQEEEQGEVRSDNN